MIEILQHGSVGPRIREFLCPACGCRFKAGPMDWEIIKDGYRVHALPMLSDKDLRHVKAACRCPECSLTAEEV